MSTPRPDGEVRDLAQQAEAASRRLATLTEAERNSALEHMALAIEAARDALLAANTGDLQAAEARKGLEALPAATLSRLRLNEAKLREMVEQIRSVAALPDPLGRRLDAIELDDRDPATASRTQAAQANPQAPGSGGDRGLRLEKISVPLGVLAVIFEARPDAVTQIAALALKSGNAVILKAGREVEQTARALVNVLRRALAGAGLPAEAIALLAGRDEVLELLGAHDLVDMVIPRGSKQLVEFVHANTRIPVLGHSEGVCHIYVDRAADPDLALRVIVDAKLDYPAACNAVETVLVHRDMAQAFVPQLIHQLSVLKVRVHGDPSVQTLGAEAGMEDVGPVRDWHTEYGEAEVSVGVVASLDDAIRHIHTYGSSHTESILTEDVEAAERFLREVDAAGVFHNTSTRFADGFRYGFGAEIGISTSKLHARGPVGLEGLTTYKYILRGAGHIAGDYRGERGRTFTHRRLQT